MENKITLPSNGVKVLKASEILDNARERIDAVEQYVNSASSNKREPEAD